MTVIRDTQQADAENVAALIDSVARERQFLASTEGFTVDGSRAFIAAVQEAGGVHVVAVRAGEIIGWCDIAPSPYEGMRHAGRLGMGVQKIHRGQGIGPRLLESAIQKAFASHIDRIELEVFASNRAAVSLYEKFGFRLEGRKIGGRKLDGVVDDVLLYAKLT